MRVTVMDKTNNYPETVGESRLLEKVNRKRDLKLQLES